MGAVTSFFSHRDCWSHRADSEFCLDFVGRPMGKLVADNVPDCRRQLEYGVGRLDFDTRSLAQSAEPSSGLELDGSGRFVSDHADLDLAAHLGSRPGLSASAAGAVVSGS